MESKVSIMSKHSSNSWQVEQNRAETCRLQGKDWKRPVIGGQVSRHSHVNHVNKR